MAAAYPKGRSPRDRAQNSAYRPTRYGAAPRGPRAAGGARALVLAWMAPHPRMRAQGVERCIIQRSRLKPRFAALLRIVALGRRRQPAPTRARAGGLGKLRRRTPEPLVPSFSARRAATRLLLPPHPFPSPRRMRGEGACGGTPSRGADESSATAAAPQGAHPVERPEPWPRPTHR